MYAAQEMFKTANKVTRPEKALILGFMAGSRGTMTRNTHCTFLSPCALSDVIRLELICTVSYNKLKHSKHLKLKTALLIKRSSFSIRGEQSGLKIQRLAELLRNNNSRNADIFSSYLAELVRIAHTLLFFSINNTNITSQR